MSNSYLQECHFNYLNSLTGRSLCYEETGADACCWMKAGGTWNTCKEGRLSVHYAKREPSPSMFMLKYGVTPPREKLTGIDEEYDDRLNSHEVMARFTARRRGKNHHSDPR